MSLPFPPSLLAAGLPITPGVFMAVMVLSACAYGVIIVFNYLSLKNKRTHRLSVISVILLVAGLLSGEASIGTMFDRDAPPLLKTIPGMLAIGVLGLAAGAGLAAFVHCSWHRHRYRRGRKRALGSLVIAAIAVGALYGISNATYTPGAHTTRSKVELLPETDAYGRVLATPGPATPAPAPAPAPSTSGLVELLPVPQVSFSTPVPAPIATPRPEGLLPRGNPR